MLFAFVLRIFRLVLITLNIKPDFDYDFATPFKEKQFMSIGFNYLDFFSDEIYMTFFQDLPPEALANAFLVHKKANRVLRDHSLWDEPLRQLRALIQEQNSDTAPLTSQQLFAQRYAQYFPLLAKMQQDEINHFLTIESELKETYADHSEELAALFETLAQFKGSLPAKNLEELRHRAKTVDTAIDQLNALMIRPVIEQAQADYQDELNLDGKKITRIPESIIEDVSYSAFFQNIETMRVSNNPLTRLPLNIDQCTHLTTLNASNTQLAFLPYTLTKLPELRTLTLNNNQLLALPDNVGKAPKLQRLFVANNQLTSLPASLANLKQLNALNICGNQLADFGFALPRLVKLGLNGNLIKVLTEGLHKALYCFEESKIQSVEELLNCQKRTAVIKP